MYAIAETVLTTWLKAAFPLARVVTELPANLATVVPCIQVTRFGGGDDVITLDAAHIDIDCYAVDRTTARDLAEQIRTSLRFQLPGQIVAGGTVAQVSTIAAPSWTPYDNTALRRFVASYRVVIHSHV